MQLKLMSYNIRMGTHNPWGLEGIARVIEAEQPDLVGLQEVNVYGYPTGPVDQPLWLARRLRMNSGFGGVREFPEFIVPNRKGQTGNALLSRWPILESTVFELPKQPDTPYRAGVLAVQVRAPFGPLNVFVTHWAVDVSAHTSQALATLEVVQNWRPALPAVLLGDLNNLPDSAAICTLRARLTDAFEAMSVPLEQRVSFPSGAPGSKTPDGWSGALDYVLLRDLAVSEARVIYDKSLASDHNPVLVRVEV